MRAIIGVSMAEEANGASFRIHHKYVEWVERCGGLPVCIPPGDKTQIPELLDHLDGFLFSGGGDVHPSFYAEEALPLLGTIESKRDGFEPEALLGAWERKMPLLTICRGMQLMNVVLGGTLWQDISYAGGELLQHVQEQDPYSATHEVALCDERLVRLLGASVLQTNSHHHQAIRRIAPSLRVAARTSDGIVEALLPSVEQGEGRFCVGLQWHPERLGAEAGSDRLFTAFVQEAEAYALRKQA